MTTTERMKRVIASMDKLPPHMALVVPVRIAHRCILRAKTNEAKTRLVQTSMWISVADTRRIWDRSWKYENFTRPRKTSKKSNAFVDFLKSLI
jgi:hypothetical protein